MVKKLKTVTDPKIRNELLRKRLEETMRDKWDCYNRDPKKRIPCRELLLFLIKTKIAFPQYKKDNPKITKKEMEELWNATSEASKSSTKSSNSKSPQFNCPRCNSDDIVFSGFQGSTAVCQNCGVTWNVLGGANNIFVAQNDSRYFGTIQAYVDKKGNEIDPSFPKIFEDNTAKEQYLRKSIKELQDILKRYEREWELPVWSKFVQQSVFLWIKYLESIPSDKGMPRKQKRSALLAVLTYYANILSNKGLQWKQMPEIFGVLREDIDKIRDNEMAIFWTTPQGNAVSTELFPLLEARETPQGKSPSSGNTLLQKIRKQEPRATKLGLDAFLHSLENKKLKPPQGVTTTQLNKQKKLIEEYFDIRPRELERLLI
tara:strand:+ start:418 stop:1536 length:1119 start_codon:yes stop_codon:yes gene_type:complete